MSITSPPLFASRQRPIRRHDRGFETPDLVISGPAIDIAEKLHNAYLLARRHQHENIFVAETFARAQQAIRPTIGDPFRQTGTLVGALYAVQDMIDVAGVPTTNGSLVVGRRKAKSDAAVVAALDGAGALLVGKTNQSELGWGLATANPFFGAVGNPHHPALTPGGASGGAAAAVAAGIVDLVLGIDTGGSVRLPAAACGVVALTPRNGMVSAIGALSLAPSFDRIAPIARTVATVALAWELLGGQAFGARVMRRWRVGVAPGFRGAEALSRLRVSTKPLPLPLDLVRWYDVAMRVEAAQVHRRLLSSAGEEIGSALREGLDEAARVPRRQRVRALSTLLEARKTFLRYLGDLDVVVAPVLHEPLDPFGSPERLPTSESGRLAAFASALDLPTLTIGDMQIIGRTEADVVEFGLRWERLAGVTLEAW